MLAENFEKYEKEELYYEKVLNNEVSEEFYVWNPQYRTGNNCINPYNREHFGGLIYRNPSHFTAHSYRLVLIFNPFEKLECSSRYFS